MQFPATDSGYLRKNHSILEEGYSLGKKLYVAVWYWVIIVCFRVPLWIKMRYLPLRSMWSSVFFCLYHFQYLFLSPSLSFSPLIMRKISRCYDIVNVLFGNVMKCYNVILWSYNAGVWNNCWVHPVHFRPETRNLNNIGDVNNVINSINHCVFNDLRPFVVLKCNLT